MPKLVHALSGLPSAVDEASQAVRFPSRILLVGWLSNHPKSQVSEIVEGIGSERAAIRRHLHALEVIGVVIASHPSGGREREWVTYSVDIPRWHILLTTLSTYPQEADRK